MFNGEQMITAIFPQSGYKQFPVNDDNQDNFYIDVPRFPSINEHKEPLYLLYTDY